MESDRPKASGREGRKKSARRRRAQLVQAQYISPFGGGVAETTAHPLALALLGSASILMLVVRRKYVIIPLLLAAFLVPMGNVVVVAGVHIMPDRMLVLFGGIRLAWGRLISQTKILGNRWNSIDTAFLYWAGFRALAAILLWRQIPVVINECGFLWSALGMYFLLRFLIRNDEDVWRTVKLLGLIAVVNGAGMAYEHLTGQNLLGVVLGGVNSFSDLREGTIRSQGAFSHSILAGTYGATLIPLLFWLWIAGRAKGFAAVALVFATVMVVTTGSSTPLLTYVAAIVGLCLWPLRGRMRLIRWGIVGVLVGLQLVMKSPVWFILNHVNVIGSSSGYHRSMLIDNFVRHFGDWWLLGVKSTAEWGWDMYDQADQFVAEGEVGGLAGFVFFILMIKRAFGALGTARRAVAGDKRQEWLLWSLGTALFAYIVAFFGISLWDQTQVAWFALFAMIGAASLTRIAKRDTGDRVPLTDSLPVGEGTSEMAQIRYSS
jgi:hypothetical protein